MDVLDLAVYRILSERGATATYKQRSTGGYDTSTGDNVESEIDVEVQAIMFDLILQKNGLSTKFDTEILAGDKEVYIRPTNKVDSAATPLTITPLLDSIVIGGVEYKVVNKKELNTNGTNVILHHLHVRV